MSPLSIRPASGADWPAIWDLMEPVLQAGDTYVWEEVTGEEARALWMDAGDVFVAFDGEDLLGTYLIKPNHPGRGSHVCNAAFMVTARAQGKGVGRTMADHALEHARSCGYTGMQFNMVVASNQRAVDLWQRMGFEVVGRVPRAFRHAERGLVDVLIMYRDLEA